MVPDEKDEAIEALLKKADLDAAAIKRLRREVSGDVLTDRLNLIAYGQTAAMYELVPAIVVVPRDVADCQAVVGFAKRHGLAITGRGGASSLAGQALSKGGIILDFSKYMGGVHEFDSEKNTIDVGPGLRLDELTRFLDGHGKFFPPDPASGSAATIGGMAANNAGGSRTVKYGATREYVRRIRLVLSDGSTAFAEPYEIGGKVDAAMEEKGDLWARILRRIERLLSENAELIEKNRPHVPKNSSGYLLYDVLDGYHFDPTKLLVGSEGTLAMFTRLRLRVLDTLPYHTITLSFYDSLHSMAEAVKVALKYDPVVLEVMDEEYIRLAKERSDVVRRFVPGSHAWVLMIEIEGNSAIEVSHRIHRLEDELISGAALAAGFVIGEGALQREELLEIRRASNNILNRTKGSRKPSDVIEDTAVNPANLEEFLARLNDLLEKLQMKVFIFGHAGSGNLHIRPILDLKKEGDLNRMVRLATDVAELVKSFGGTLGGEHGDGRLRTPLLKNFFPELYPLFVKVKNIFDPANIFNPGIIATEEYLSPAVIKEDTKFGPEYSFADTRTPFDDDVAREDIEACHGCGYCRDFCPAYAASGDELDTPRARSAVLRHLISGKLPAGSLADADLGRMIASCMGCGRCERLCFAESGYGKLDFRAHLSRGESKQPSVGERLLADIPWLYRLRKNSPALFDRLRNSGWARRALAGLTGAAPDRPLPSFNRVPLSKFYPARDTYRTYEKPLAYFHGCHAGFINVAGEGIPGIRLLEGLGYDLIVPRQGCCGLPKLSSNDSAGAKKDADEFVKAFLPLAERGVPIVTTCPSCAHYLHEALPLLVEEDIAAKITPLIYEINELLVKDFDKPDAPRLVLPVPLRAALHISCHEALLGADSALRSVLGRIKGLELVELTDECCGMGGGWGLKQTHAAASKELGRKRAREIASKYVDAIITPCGMCALQLVDLTKIRAIHPVELLDEALQFGKKYKPKKEAEEVEGIVMPADETKPD